MTALHANRTVGYSGRSARQLSGEVLHVHVLQFVLLQRDDVGLLRVDDPAEHFGLLLHQRAQAGDVPGDGLERFRATGDGLPRRGILRDDLGKLHFRRLGLLLRGGLRDVPVVPGLRRRGLGVFLLRRHVGDARSAARSQS